MKVKSIQAKGIREKAPSAESVFGTEACRSSHRSWFSEQNLVGKSDSCSLRIRVPVFAGIWVVPRKSSSLCRMRAIFFGKRIREEKRYEGYAEINP